MFFYERRGRRYLVERLRTIAEMNHHVRNALEVITNSAYLQQEDKLRRVLCESSERIEWALREVLPGNERRYWPEAKAGGQEGGPPVVGEKTGGWQGEASEAGTRHLGRIANEDSVQRRVLAWKEPLDLHFDSELSQCFQQCRGKGWTTIELRQEMPTPETDLASLLIGCNFFAERFHDE